MSTRDADRVRGLLADIEARHDVRVLIAVESGSRALGFASPDSDFDVRFVYQEPLVLSIWQASDGLEATARHAIYGGQWRRLDRELLGLLQDRARV